MKDLRGHVALVTGAVGGLGSAIVAALLTKGCKVALLDINEGLGTKAATRHQKEHGKESCVFYKCDVTNEPQLEECFKNTRSKFGRLDIVINNAGIFKEENWRMTFAINTEAVYSGILLGLKYMGKDNGFNGGHIISTSSIAGIYVLPSVPAYNASKVAVVAMTRAFGAKLHLDRHGVRVNCVCPDPINTPLWGQISGHFKLDPITAPLHDVYDKRAQRPEDVARGFIKLLEDDDKNGAALLSLHTDGLQYYNFQEPTPEF
ncbi:15-hydroxyprostaglandin dehydrogenase [NAD(+)]-like [Ixodes scapularis]